MASVEALARLNPKTVRFDVGSGGIPELTPEMIAGACAGLPDLSYRLGLVKYAGQERELRNLKISVLMAAADLAVKHYWGKPKPGQLTGLSNYAIVECVGYHNCFGCNGAGQVIDQWRHSRVCGTCRGTGKASRGDDERAALAGFSPSDWLKTWASRGDRLVAVLELADARARSKIFFELNGTA